LRYRGDFLRAATFERDDKVLARVLQHLGMGGRATDRDVAVTRTAQGIFKLILWAAGWRVVVKGVYPRHFSSGFHLGGTRQGKRAEFAP
jgi:hypothetical protein